MSLFLGLHILGGVLGYLAGIFGFSYLHGRRNPYEYSMEGGEIFLLVIWPIVLVLAIPVGIVFGIIIGISKLADLIRDIGADQVKQRIQAEQRQRIASEQVDQIEMFEDERDVESFS